MTHVVLLSSKKTNWLITVKRSKDKGKSPIYGRWISDHADITLEQEVIIEQQEPGNGFKKYKISHIHWNYNQKECTLYVIPLHEKIQG